MKKLSNEARFNLKLFAMILFFVGILLLFSCNENNNPVSENKNDYYFEIIYFDEGNCRDVYLSLNSKFAGYIKNQQKNQFKAIEGKNIYQFRYQSGRIDNGEFFLDENDTKFRMVLHCF